MQRFVHQFNGNAKYCIEIRCNLDASHTPSKIILEKRIFTIVLGDYKLKVFCVTPAMDCVPPVSMGIKYLIQQ